jgi:glucose/arabinose dehydrogenase
LRFAALRLASAGLAAACLTFAFLPTLVSAEPALPEGFQDSIAFDNLEQPTNFRFSADGRVFVAEKAGVIKVYDGLGDPTAEVFADLRTQVYDKGDRGLLGLALDPDFPDTPYVYALYTYDHILGDSGKAPKWGKADTTGDPCPEPNGADDCLVSGRLVRLTAVGGSNHALEDKGAPVEKTLAEDWCQQFSSHSIGDLQFGPEGALYASGGDGASFTGADYGQFGTPANPCSDPPGGFGTALTPPSAEGGSLRAQNLHNLSGKIIRVDPDSGEGWPDNPMAASADPNTKRIVAEGFRNPFRFTIDPKTGEIYTDNVGSSEIEEIDRFAAPPASVYNSGWPCYEGPVHQFLFDPLNLTVCEQLYAEHPPSTSPPFFYYSHAQEVVPGDECSFDDGSALGGLTFYEGNSYPSPYKGALFFTDAVRGCIYAMFPGQDGKPDPFTTTRFLREAQIYPGVDIEQGPGGDLYYASLFGDEEFGPGAIHRISYNPGAPTARLSADPQWGDELPLDVHLDASKSTDPDKKPLAYEWDLDGDGTFETNGQAARTVAFSKSKNRVIAVRVEDEEGLSSVARVTVYPGDSPPELTVEKPSSSFDWNVGQEIEFVGSAIDAEGHHLPGLSFYWSTRLAHCPTSPENCHKHPLQVFSGVAEGSFIAPEHDYPSYIEITMRAADDRGLTASKTVKIDPRTVDLSIGSSPPGIQLTAGLKAATAPFTLTAIEGSNVVLSAPQTAQLGDRAYIWQGWSDGGARVHAVLADASAAYTASYRAQAPTVETPPQKEPGKPIRVGLPPTFAPHLRKHPAKTTQSTSARFVFSSGVKGIRFRCKLDRGRYRPCHSPIVYRHLVPGTHLFGLLAISPSGERLTRSFSWRVVR